jgi:DinB superfamily
VGVIDFEPYRRREKSLQDLAEGLGPDDLARLTNEMCDRQLELIREADDPDVTFVPEDPEADDPFAADDADRELAWTLGHVIVHTTASAEEGAAHALTLARGLEVDGRSRYEVPWQEATTARFLRERIEESRRMRLSMLQAWPSRPHLDVLYQPSPKRPPQNAVARFLGGLAHDDAHLGQIAKVLAQARAARAASPRA